MEDAKFATGLPTLDDLLGGGCPTGLLLVYGAEDTGKTCLGLSILKECSEPTGVVDLQSTMDPKFVAAIDQNILYTKPTTAEAGVEAASSMIRHGVKVVLLDTVDAMTPVTELNTFAGERETNAHKRLVYHSAYALYEVAKYHNALVILTAQVRSGLSRAKPRAMLLDQLIGMPCTMLGLRCESTRAEYGINTNSTIQITLAHSSFVPPGASCRVILERGVGFNSALELFKYMRDQDLLDDVNKLLPENMQIKNSPAGKERVRSNYREITELVSRVKESNGKA